MTTESVTARGLSVRRGGQTVLDSIDLNIEAGSVTGLLGPSGCGKSTLMRSLVGVQAKVSGQLSVLGLPAGDPALRTRVGYSTQAASVYEDLSIAENLRYFASLIGLRRGLARREAERVAERVGLSAISGQRVESLSGGQRGRVSLAAALLGEPDLLVLDEPTVGLDPVLREELWVIFRGLADDGTTLLISSHVMGEALRCDNLLLMRDGQMLATLTPDELLERSGTTDPEAAFLSIIESTERAGKARHASLDDAQKAEEESL